MDEYVAAQQRIAQLQADSARILVELAEIARAQTARSGSDSRFEFATRSMAAEVAAAVRIPDGTVRARMADAITLVTGFPATFAAFQDGRISDAHARVIVAAGERLDDDESRAEYESIILPRAVETTPTRARAVAKAVAERIDPLPLTERHQQAMDTRGVWASPLEDGMGELRIIAPAALVFGAHDRATQMAQVIKRECGDGRTLDQIRADVLTDLLLTATPTEGEGLDAIRATVQVTVPADTITGLGDDAAFLAGYGPVDPDTARRLAGSAPTWVRLFTDPATGCLRTVDGYTPTAAQRRYLVARDEHCRFPGCRQPARRCDLDHTIAYAERGPTAVTNLGHLCEAHHVLKHNSPWRKREGEDGTTEWISPLGRVYRHAPTPVVRFQALQEVVMPDLAPPF